MTTRRDFRRILLIRRKALGDALVTMPAVLAVARAWPRAAIDLVVDRPFADLLSGLTADVRVLAWPPPAGVTWWRQLRQGHYDLVVDWLGNPRTAWWTILTGAAVRVGYDLPRRGWAYNVKVPRNRTGCFGLRGFAGEAFLDPLRTLGLAPEPWRDGFAREHIPPDSMSAGVREAVQSWLARPGVPAVLVMSATWPAKRWPAGHIHRLLADLPAVGVNPLLVPGPDDRWQFEGLDAGGQGALVAPPTTLAELADIMARAELFVGTDCGPRHLAAALGLPTVTIFGPTDPLGWNPPSPRHVAVRNPVPCAPCDLKICPVVGHPCLANLSPGTVIASVAGMVESNRQGAVRGQQA